jgi:hypothetical protein
VFPKPEAIYQCPATQRYYDPLVVRRALRAADPAILAYRAAVTEQDEAAREAAEEKIVAVARRAFAVPPVDPKTGDGTPDAIVMRAVVAFTRWLSGKGGTAQSGPSSAPCTDCR